MSTEQLLILVGLGVYALIRWLAKNLQAIGAPPSGTGGSAGSFDDEFDDEDSERASELPRRAPFEPSPRAQEPGALPPPRTYEPLPPAPEAPVFVPSSSRAYERPPPSPVPRAVQPPRAPLRSVEPRAASAARLVQQNQARPRRPTSQAGVPKAAVRSRVTWARTALLPDDPVELRRAIVQMTILGPPRALDPVFRPVFRGERGSRTNK